LKGHQGLQQRVLDSALSQFPIIGDQIRSNIHSLSKSGVALALGIAGALWAGMAGMKAAQNAMDTVWGVPIRRQGRFLPQLLKSIVMLAVLGSFVLISTGLSGFGTGSTAPMWARLFTFPASLAMNSAVFLLAFKVLTVEDVGWRDVLPGALIASVAWAALQAIGGYYVGHQLKNASQVYGFFGIVIGLLSWLYLASQVTLLAAEVNVVRRYGLWPRSLGGEPSTEADKRTLALHARVEERATTERIDVAFDGEDPMRAGDRAKHAS
jgi:YihY family inner membrane protein